MVGNQSVTLSSMEKKGQLDGVEVDIDEGAKVLLQAGHPPVGDDPHLVAADVNDRELDFVADHDRFVDLP